MRLWLVLTAALVLPGPRAFAQIGQYSPDHGEDDSGGGGGGGDDIGPVSLRAGGILALPLGETSERFEPGGGFTAGLTLAANLPVGVRLDYLYSRYGIRDDALSALSLDGHHTLQAFTLGMLVRPTRGTRAGIYFLAGPGLYYRDVTISHAARDRAGAYCDAFLFFCLPREVPASEVIGSESSIDFGLNAGVGVYLMLAPPLRLDLEARYHYVWGPTFRTFTGQTVDSDAGYLPVVLALAY
jgi:opacity protein-like surface antigen